MCDDAGSDVAVAIGRCDGASTPPPLAPLAEILPALDGDGWPSMPAEATTASTRLHLFTELVAMLRSPPGGGPVLLVVEDLHWGDEAAPSTWYVICRDASTGAERWWW